MKYRIITIVSFIGSAVISLLGGWDKSLQTLIIFMTIDWLTGGILFPKSQNGALESHAGWKGLCRKAMTLFYVLVGAQLDSLMGTEYVRDAVCIGFICNEALSIIENAGLMGMPLPEILRKSIDALKSEKNA